MENKRDAEEGGGGDLRQKEEEQRDRVQERRLTFTGRGWGAR